MADRLADRLADLMDGRGAAPTPTDEPTLWAGHRTINSTILAALVDDAAPRSAWLLLGAHAVAFGGRDRHRTHLAVIATRSGASKRTVGSTTDWFVARGYLDHAGPRRYALGERWRNANADKRARFAAYSVVSTVWQAALRGEPDRAALARTSLALACLLGKLAHARLPAERLAGLSGEPVQHARARLNRLRDLKMIVDVGDAVAFGPGWPTV